MISEQRLYKIEYLNLKKVGEQKIRFKILICKGEIFLFNKDQFSHCGTLLPSSSQYTIELQICCLSSDGLSVPGHPSCVSVQTGCALQLWHHSGTIQTLSAFLIVDCMVPHRRGKGRENLESKGMQAFLVTFLSKCPVPS